MCSEYSLLKDPLFQRCHISFIILVTSAIYKLWLSAALNKCIPPVLFVFILANAILKSDFSIMSFQDFFDCFSATYSFSSGNIIISIMTDPDLYFIHPIEEIHMYIVFCVASRIYRISLLISLGLPNPGKARFLGKGINPTQPGLNWTLCALIHNLIGSLSLDWPVNWIAYTDFAQSDIK